MPKRIGALAVTNSFTIWFNNCSSTARMDDHKMMSAFTTKFIIILTKGINCKELKIVSWRMAPSPTAILRFSDDKCITITSDVIDNCVIH